MGYSHAWRLKDVPSDEAWARVIADVELLLVLPEVKKLKIIGRQRPFLTRPQLDEEHILLNGRRETGFEALHVKRSCLVCGFVKTNWMPYDPVVVAVLALLAHHLGSEGIAVQLGGNVALGELARGLVKRVRPEADLPREEDPFGKDFEFVAGRSQS